MEDYIKLASQYPITITPIPQDEGAGYYVSSTYFPGIHVDMETVDEAIAEFRTVLADVIKDSLENGRSIPQITSDEYSGKMSLRMSKSLHRQLAHRAELEGVSMNALVVQYIAQGLENVPVSKVSAPNNGSIAHAYTDGSSTTYSCNNIVSIFSHATTSYSTPIPNCKDDNIPKEM